MGDAKECEVGVHRDGGIRLVHAWREGAKPERRGKAAAAQRVTTVGEGGGEIKCEGGRKEGNRENQEGELNPVEDGNRFKMPVEESG